MDKRSIWILCGVFLYFTSCIRLFSVHSIDVEVSPLIDQFSKYEMQFVLYWVAISLIAKIIGAKLFGHFADNKNIFYAIRVCAATNVVAAVFMAICFLTKVWFFRPYSFFYLVRFFQAFLEPAVLVLSAIFLIKINTKISAIYTSAIINIVAGLGIICAYLISGIISTYQINDWYLLFFAISVVGFWCFISGTREIYADKATAEIYIKSSATKQEKILVFSLGACCLAIISNITFCFDRFVHDRMVIESSLQILSSLYFYIYLLVALIPSAFLCKKIGIPLAAKIGLYGSILTILITYSLSLGHIFFIVVSLLSVFFASLFLVSNHAMLHDSYCKTRRYEEPLLWFTLGYVVCGLFNVVIQKLAAFPLHITGIISSIPVIVMYLVCTTTINNKQQPEYFSSAPIVLHNLVHFKWWCMPAKIRANISSLRISC
jgi:MFS family permease